MSEPLRAIDLFAGIGGIRMAWENAFGDQLTTVFSSEWNKYSNQTYEANFHDDFPITGDITQVPAVEIPDCDVVLAGFPCQPFSIAGVSKKNSLGRPTGFEDKTQGTLFFDVARIIAAKQPKVFMLENVKNLTSHDHGNTFKVITQVLTEDLGYHVHWKVIDSKHWTCQHRERIYIVGFREDVAFDWADLEVPTTQHVLADILEEGVPEKYTLSDKLWGYLQDYAARHKAKGNGFGYGLVGPGDTTRTLSARYYKDGSEILVNQGPDKNPRRLTPRECARLQGFPDSFEIPVSDTQAYRQFGNSVTVPAVQAVAELIGRSLKSWTTET